METRSSFDEEDVSSMQQEMEELKRRENELARKIAMANQKQKSLSGENLANANDSWRPRITYGSTKKTSGMKSPTRDYFQGRNIEIKVAKYIRGEEPYRRRTSDSGLRQHSPTRRSYGTLSPTRGVGLIRSTSNPDNSKVDYKSQKLNKESSWEEQRTLYQSAPNLSIIKIENPEDSQVDMLSQEDGILRSRSKRGTRGGMAVRHEQVNMSLSEGQQIQEDVKPTMTRSSVSLELRQSNDNLTEKRLSFLEVDNDVTLAGEEEESSVNSTFDFTTDKQFGLDEVSGSTIDIDSIIGSGDVTKEEIYSDDENEMNRPSWNPDEMIASDDVAASLQPDHFHHSAVADNENLVKSTNRTLSIGSLSHISSEDLRTDEEAEEEISAREQILDAKSKIELEIEDLRRREKELRNSRSDGKAKREYVTDDEEDEDKEEYFEAKDTLSVDTRGLIEKEIDEFKQRELELKQRREKLYGTVVEESSSEEEDNDASIPMLKEGKDPRGKIELEMQESIARENEFHNRLASMTIQGGKDTSNALLGDDWSSSEDEEPITHMDPVTKIEKEIEEVRQREEELRRSRMRSVPEYTSLNDTEVEEGEEKVIKTDPMSKIITEIEEESKRDLELKKRYGRVGYSSDDSDVNENDEFADEDWILERKHKQNDAFELRPDCTGLEESKANVKDGSPGKLRIPSAFQNLPRIPQEQSNNLSEKEAKTRVLREIEAEERREAELRTQHRVSFNEREPTKSYYIDSSDDEGGEDTSAANGIEEKHEIVYTRKKCEEDEDEIPQEFKEAPVLGTVRKGTTRKKETMMRPGDPDLDSLKAGFTKEKVFLFDPSRKQPKPQIKANKVTKTREKFESKIQNEIPSNIQDRYSSKLTTEKVSSREADGQETKKIDNIGDIDSDRLLKEEEKSATSSSQQRKRLVLKRKGSDKKGRYERDQNGSVSSWVKQRKSNIDEEFIDNDIKANRLQEADRNNTKGVQVSKVTPSTASNERTTDEQANTYIANRKREIDESRRHSETYQRQKAQMIVEEQLKKRDKKIETEKQKEKRKHLAESWEKKQVSLKEDNLNGITDGRNQETISVDNTLLIQKKEEKSIKSSRPLRSSASLRVKQWERRIATQGH